MVLAPGFQLWTFPPPKGPKGRIEAGIPWFWGIWKFAQHKPAAKSLLTFLSERYERRSVVVTSNLVFSEWDKIFKDPMTTAAAIDRVVHHATIIELTGPSYRADEAQERNKDLDLGEKEPHEKDDDPNNPKDPKNPKDSKPKE